MRFTKNCVSFVVLGLVACAGADQPPSGPVEPIGPSGTEIETAQVQEALSNGPECNTSPPEVIIVRSGGTSSPDSYPGETCTAAEVIDLKNYLPGSQVCQGFIGAGGSPSCSGFASGVSVFWDAPVPTNQANCEAARVMAYAWDTTTGTPVAKGFPTALGTWNGSCCAPPTINVASSTIGPLEAGHSYRFAISARQGPSAADTRRVGFRAL